MDCSEHAEITDGLEQETKDLIKSYWAKVGVSPPVHDGTKGHTGNAPQAGSNECISTTFMASAWCVMFQDRVCESNSP